METRWTYIFEDITSQEANIKIFCVKLIVIRVEEAWKVVVVDDDEAYIDAITESSIIEP